eukprot:5375469-Amphidinium_carterae.1
MVNLSNPMANHVKSLCERHCLYWPLGPKQPILLRGKKCVASIAHSRGKLERNHHMLTVMTDPAFQANATAAGFTQQQSSLFETAVREAVPMAR